jgi:Ca2+-binding EF-hand superfamily protein
MFVSGLALMLLQAAATPAPAPARPAPPPITKAFIQNQSKLTFERLDTNKDGWVDKAEAQKGVDTAVATATKDRADRLAASFAKLDTNKDGSISRQEFEAVLPPIQRPAGLPWMDSNDTDKNGRVSLAEANAAAVATFDRVDTDHNGVVSATELRAAEQRPAAKR